MKLSKKIKTAFEGPRYYRQPKEVISLMLKDQLRNNKSLENFLRDVLFSKRKFDDSFYEHFPEFENPEYKFYPSSN